MVTQPAYERQLELSAQQRLTREQLAQQQKQFEMQLAQQQAMAPKRVGISDITRLMERFGPSPQVSLGGDIAAQEDAARAAAFGRARDIAAQQALAGLQAVGDITAERGLMGSTYEGGLLRDVIGGAGGTIADATREQLLQDLARSRERANLQYQGGITQRGQDLAQRQAILALLGQLY